MTQGCAEQYYIGHAAVRGGDSKRDNEGVLIAGTKGADGTGKHASVLKYVEAALFLITQPKFMDVVIEGYSSTTTANGATADGCHGDSDVSGSASALTGVTASNTGTRGDVDCDRPIGTKRRNTSESSKG